MKKLVILLTLIAITVFAVGQYNSLMTAKAEAREIPSIAFYGQAYNFQEDYYWYGFSSEICFKLLSKEQQQAASIISVIRDEKGVAADIRDVTDSTVLHTVTLFYGKTYTQTITVYLYGTTLYKAEYEIGGNDENN